VARPADPEFWAQQVRLHRTKHGGDHPRTLSALSDLAEAHYSSGDMGRATAVFRDLLPRVDAVHGPHSSRALKVLRGLAHALLIGGDAATGEPFMREARDRCADARGRMHPDTLQAEAALACFLSTAGRRTEAERLMTRAIQGWEAVGGAHHPSTLKCVGDLALMLQRSDPVRSVELTQRAIRGLVALHGEDHPATVRQVHNLGITLARAGNPVGAIPVLRAALQGAARARSRVQIAQSASSLGEILLLTGDAQAAFDLSLRAYRLLERDSGARPEDAAMLQGIAAGIVEASCALDEGTGGKAARHHALTYANELLELKECGRLHPQFLGRATAALERFFLS